MLLSIIMPHSGHDEEDYIEALANEGLHGLDSIDW